MTQRRVEVFIGGCPMCVDAVELIGRLACPSCDVTVVDVNEPQLEDRAEALGVRSVPAIAVDGTLLECCKSGIDESAVRAAGVGAALS